MITVCDWSGLNIGQPSTISSVRSCSCPAKEWRGTIHCDGTLLQGAAGVAVRRPGE